ASPPPACRSDRGYSTAWRSWGGTKCDGASNWPSNRAFSCRLSGDFMSVLVVGTVAQDTIETPYGAAPYVLGGSATFFSWAASFFTQVHLVGIVGDDFPPKHIDLLAKRGIDLRGLVTKPGGKSFYWHGRYHADMNSRD